MEQVKKIKGEKLRVFFIKYTISFCIMTLSLLALTAGLFMSGISSGHIWPANYVETLIAEAKPQITSAEKISPDLIPALCEYAVFSLEGEYLYGSLSKESADHAWAVAVSGAAKGSGYQYAVVERSAEVCILKYVIKPTFRSAAARKTLPNVEVPFIVLFMICFTAGSAFLTYRFAKILSMKMSGLQDAATKIQQQDLDFLVRSCGIHEIDKILLSFDQMKQALQNSLQQQWNLEQTKKEQISALAHDIKSPVTIIRGNAELLKETDLDDIQTEYVKYIFNNADQIEKYVKQLIEIFKMQDNLSARGHWVDTNTLLDDIEVQMKSLAGPKNIQTQIEKYGLPEKLYLDKDLFLRAVINIVDNAAEYTPNNGTIILKAEAQQEKVKFHISDSGRGFSQADLRQAADQFYMGDKSRASSNHYGMGLYIAQSIIKQHGGDISFGNDPLIGGGKVTVELYITAQIPESTPQ